MRTSDQINELAAALAKAQSEIKTAEKDKTNPHFGQSYATLASTFDAVRIPLSKNNLSVSQLVDSDGEDSFLYTRLMHSSGQFEESRAKIKAVQNTPQGFGSALTYMRRYMLQSIVGVAQGDDDDDGNNGSKKDDSKKQDKKEDDKQKDHSAAAVSSAQITRLFTIATKRSWSNDAVKEFMIARFKKDSTKDLTKYEYDLLVDEIQKFDPETAMGGLK